MISAAIHPIKILSEETAVWPPKATAVLLTNLFLGMIKNYSMVVIIFS